MGFRMTKIVTRTLSNFLIQGEGSRLPYAHKNPILYSFPTASVFSKDQNYNQLITFEVLPKIPQATTMER